MSWIKRAAGSWSTWAHCIHGKAACLCLPNDEITCQNDECPWSTHSFHYLSWFHSQGMAVSAVKISLPASKSIAKIIFCEHDQKLNNTLGMCVEVCVPGLWQFTSIITMCIKPSLYFCNEARLAMVNKLSHMFLNYVNYFIICAWERFV